MATKADDNRYSHVKYNQTKYGISALRDALGWGIDIDWDGNGYFDGVNEGDRLLKISIDRGRTNYLRPRGDGFETVRTGIVKLTFDNGDGRYDAWNTSSPLYPNVTYGRDVRIRVRDNSTGTIRNVFYGVISNIEPIGYGADRKVIITVEDGWRYLREYTARVQLTINTFPNDACDAVLDYIGWPARWGRNLDNSSDIISYWWASGSKLAGEEMEDLANSFLSYFFITADGKARYVFRQSVADSVLSLDEDVLLKDISNPQPWLYSRNIVRIKTHPKIAANSGTIWEMQNSDSIIQAGGTFVIWANYSYDGVPVPAKNVLPPEGGVDWTANTDSAGNGTDKTSSVTLTFTDFGDTAKLVFVNNDANAVYIIDPKIRGEAIYEPNNVDITYPTNPVGVVQPREMILDLQWQQDFNVSKDFVDVIGPYMAALHLFPAIKIENRPSLQFLPELFDVITLSVAALGVSSISFRVGGISHESLSTPQAILTTFYLEPFISSSGFWIWDTASDFNDTTVFGW